MYTRCPSCRAEISFEPPANMESLPDGYKHRIKCPSCGVTIGVKINKIDTTPATLVQQAPAYTQPQTNFEPVYANEEAAAVPQTKVKAKHSGVGRNITMMIMSLLFIALSVVGYLVNEGKITNDLYGISWFDGITYWDILIQDADVFSLVFAGADGKLDILGGIVTIIPMILFTLAGINFVVALVSACGKKYGRAYNLIMSVILAGLSIFMAFYPFVCFNTEGEKLLPYLQGIVTKEEFALFVSVGLGLLQLIFGLCFCKSLKRKEKKIK